MERKLILINSEGREIEVDQLLDIHLDSTNRDYLVYTKNESDEEGVRIYVSEVVEKDDTIYFDSIASDKAWEEIKDQISKIVRESVDEEIKSNREVEKRHFSELDPLSQKGCRITKLATEAFEIVKRTQMYGKMFEKIEKLIIRKKIDNFENAIKYIDNLNENGEYEDIKNRILSDVIKYVDDLRISYDWLEDMIDNKELFETIKLKIENKDNHQDTDLEKETEVIDNHQDTDLEKETEVIDNPQDTDSKKETEVIDNPQDTDSEKETEVIDNLQDNDLEKETKVTNNSQDTDLEIKPEVNPNLSMRVKYQDKYRDTYLTPELRKKGFTQNGKYENISNESINSNNSMLLPTSEEKKVLLEFIEAINYKAKNMKIYLDKFENMLEGRKRQNLSEYSVNNSKELSEYSYLLAKYNSLLELKENLEAINLGKIPISNKKLIMKTLSNSVTVYSEIISECLKQQKIINSQGLQEKNNQIQKIIYNFYKRINDLI